MQAHWLFWQVNPGPHTLPHAPQLLGSTLLSVQAPPHTSCPPGHWHVPPLQVWPVAQAVPQAPQLLASDEVLTHVPLQLFCPVKHAQVPP